MDLKSVKFNLKHLVATGLSQLRSEAQGNFAHRSLMYHSLENKYYRAEDLYLLKMQKFIAQMDWLKDEGYRFVPFDANTFEKNESAKPFISVTFDDGFLDNYTEAFGPLVERGIPFTIFIVADFIPEAKSEYLNKSHIMELSKSPLVTLGTHGRTHRPLVSLDPAEAIEELRISKDILENIIGKQVTTMSFPHGSFNDWLLDKAQELGYEKCGTSIALPNPSLATCKTFRQALFFCETQLSFQQKVRGQWDWLGGR